MAKRAALEKLRNVRRSTRLGRPQGELYLWVYIYDDAGELLYEAGCYAQQLERIEKLNQDPPEGAKPKP